jgi:hypothetical protein
VRLDATLVAVPFQGGGGGEACWREEGTLLLQAKGKGKGRGRDTS